MPGPEAPADVVQARLLADLAQAGLALDPAEVPGVLETARFLERANARVAACLREVGDAPR